MSKYLFSERLMVSEKTKKRLLQFVRENEEVNNFDEAIQFLLDFYYTHRGDSS